MFGTSAYGAVEYGGEQQRGLNYTSIISDSFSVSASALKGVGKSFLAAMSISTLERIATIGRSRIDTISTTDYFSSLFVYFRELSESISISATIRKSISRMMSEASAISAIIKKKAIKVFSATTTFSASMEKLVVMVVTLVDFISITATISRIISRIFANSISITASFSRSIHKFLTLTANTTITASILVMRLFSRIFSDTTIITAVIGVLKLLSKPLSYIKSMVILGKVKKTDVISNSSSDTTLAASKKIRIISKVINENIISKFK